MCHRQLAMPRTHLQVKKTKKQAGECVLLIETVKETTHERYSGMNLCAICAPLTLFTLKDGERKAVSSKDMLLVELTVAANSNAQHTGRKGV